MRVDLHRIDACVAEADHAGVGPGCDQEVVLELTLIAVVREVDAGIDVLIENPPVRRDIRTPPRRIVADEVVGLAEEPERTGDGCIGIGARELHAQHGAAGPLRSRGCGLTERQHRFGALQEERVAGPAGEKVDVPLGLTDVGLEAQRQLAPGPSTACRRPCFGVGGQAA